MDTSLCLSSIQFTASFSVFWGHPVGYLMYPLIPSLTHPPTPQHYTVSSLIFKEVLSQATDTMEAVTGLARTTPQTTDSFRELQPQVKHGQSSREARTLKMVFLVPPRPPQFPTILAMLCLEAPPHQVRHLIKSITGMLFFLALFCFFYLALVKS